MKFKACHKCVPPKRHVGCHDTCPEYQEEVAKNEDEKAARRMGLAEEYEIDSVRNSVNKRTRRYKNRRWQGR